MAAEQEWEMAASGEPRRVLGVVADPDMSKRIGLRLTDALSDWLNEQAVGEWDVDVLSDPVSAGETDTEAVLASVDRNRRERRWDYGLCVTDLPLFHRGQPVLAEIDDKDGVAFISLPALGAFATRRRLWRMLTIALAAVLAPEQRRNADLDPSIARRIRFGVMSFVKLLPRGPRVAIRYGARGPVGWVGLLAGMVLANRPWRLVFGLSSAVVTSLATSAFGLSSSTLWQIGDQLDVIRKVLTAVLSTVLLVVWLIASHHLWERRRSSVGSSSRLSTLYNSSTAVTLSVGVCCMYVCLFAMNVVVASVLIPESLLAKTLEHPIGFVDYLGVAWSFTAIGMLAGALGTSLQSDRSVRQAAYGYRERQRRREYQHSVAAREAE